MIFSDIEYLILADVIQYKPIESDPIYIYRAERSSKYLLLLPYKINIVNETWWNLQKLNDMQKNKG